MARLRSTTNHDFALAVEHATIHDQAPPRAVHTHTARGTVSQANRNPNPPGWLQRLDLEPYHQRIRERRALAQQLRRDT